MKASDCLIKGIEPLEKVLGPDQIKEKGPQKSVGDIPNRHAVCRGKKKNQYYFEEPFNNFSV